MGIAPGANMSDTHGRDVRGHASAPRRAMPAKDYVNPGSMILSAEMMLRHIGWAEAADLIIGVDGGCDPAQARVTYDFALASWEGATQVSVRVSVRP